MGPKGWSLELDGYNEELKAAFEYNGIQHYQYHEFFHNGPGTTFLADAEGLVRFEVGWGWLALGILGILAG